jgi:hypothetical protein
MEYYPYRTGPAFGHRIAGVGLVALGLLFGAVGIVVATHAVRERFWPFLALGAFFGAFAIAGVFYGRRGLRGTRRLATQRYGITIDGDEVRSLSFDPLGDHESTFRRSDLVRGTERRYDKRIHLHVELRDGSYRWFPTWRLSLQDAIALHQQLGIDPPTQKPRHRAPAPAIHDTAGSPAASTPVATPANPTPFAEDAVPSAPRPKRAAPPGPVAGVTDPADGGIYASPRLLRLVDAWIAVVHDELGITLLGASERVAGRGFRFGLVEEEPDAPWLDVRELIAYAPMGYEAGREWGEELHLIGGRDTAGRPIDLVLSSEMLSDAGWCWSIRSTALDAAAVTRLGERFAARHDPKGSVNPAWTWLLSPEDRAAQGAPTSSTSR